MPNWIARLLEEMAMVEEVDSRQRKYQCLKPFQLLGQDGTPFSVFVFSKGEGFESAYFTMTSVDEMTSCVELEVLLLSCCGMKLFRTEAKIVIDLACFCGFKMIDSPIYHFMQKLYVTTDQICFSFKTLKMSAEKIIFEIKQRELPTTATVTVEYSGPELELQLLLNTREKDITWIIAKESSCSMTLTELRSIKMMKSNEYMTGEIKIKLNFLETEIIYF